MILGARGTIDHLKTFFPQTVIVPNIEKNCSARGLYHEVGCSSTLCCPISQCPTKSWRPAVMASALPVAFRTLFTCLFIFMFGFCAKNKLLFFFFFCLSYRPTLTYLNPLALIPFLCQLNTNFQNYDCLLILSMKRLEPYSDGKQVCIPISSQCCSVGSCSRERIVQTHAALLRLWMQRPMAQLRISLSTVWWFYSLFSGCVQLANSPAMLPIMD